MSEVCGICSKPMRRKHALMPDGTVVHEVCLRLRFARERWDDPNATSPAVAGIEDERPS